jgi:hypothetical protein
MGYGIFFFLRLYYFFNWGINLRIHSILLEYASRNCGEVMGFASFAIASIRLLDLEILLFRLGCPFLIGL